MPASCYTVQPCTKNSAAFGTDGDCATTQTIINIFMEIGLDKLVLNKLAAFNLTEKFLLENIPVTPTVINAVARLAKAGYTIALDDYIYNPAHAPLLHLADIVKIGLSRFATDEIQEHVMQLRQYDAKLLAEKIETPEDFILCPSYWANCIIDTL